MKRADHVYLLVDMMAGNLNPLPCHPELACGEQASMGAIGLSWDARTLNFIAVCNTGVPW
jgi:hypothetical protein